MAKPRIDPRRWPSHLRAGLASGWFLFGCLSGLICLASGCTLWRGVDPLREDPLASEVPLVIGANFEIPEDSPVIQEVRALRSELERDLGLELSNRRIHVHLFRDEGAFRKFAEERFPQLADRRAIFVSGPTGCQIHALWSESITSDLRHELTHAYLHTAVGTLPLWLDEGLAEYYEVSPYPGRINPEHLPTLAKLRQTGYLRLDLERLSAMETPEELTSGHYAEAWLWVHYLMDGGQREIVTDYLHSLRDGMPTDSIPARISAELPAPQANVLRHFDGMISQVSQGTPDVSQP